MDQNDTNDKDKAVGDSGAISSDLIRGHINTIILRTLYDGDKYGYEIISEIEEKSRGQYALKQPTLYSALKRLESQDYVTSYWGGVSNGGRRKYFQITDKGRKVVEQNLAEWEYSRTVIDSLISEKDYDFTNPPPASNVDFSLLKRSTSRVPVMKGEDEADDIELAEAQPSEPAPEPAPAQPKQQAVLAGWTREDPLEAMQAAEPAAESPAEETAAADAEQAASEPAAESKEESAAEAAPQPAIITQESSARWTREHPLENAMTETSSDESGAKDEFARTLEGDPVADGAESGEAVIEESRPLTEEERQRIHENYRNLIGDGIGDMITGLIGGPAGTNYGENISTMAITKVFSVPVLVAAAIIAMVVSCFTPLIQGIYAIPTAVIGGLEIYLFGAIAAQGIAIMIDKKCDMFSSKNIAVIAFIMIVGLGGQYAFGGNIPFPGFDSGIPCVAGAAVGGIILNLLLSFGEKKKKAGAKDETKEEIASEEA